MTEPTHETPASSIGREQVPDVAGVVEGYRYWYFPDQSPETLVYEMRRGGRTIRASRPYLRSPGASFTIMEDGQELLCAWPPHEAAVAEHLGPYQADLGHPGVPAPLGGCQCGLYAYREFYSIWNSMTTYGYVGGKVAMWGKVIPHARGYRAQYAKVVELYTTKARDIYTSEKRPSWWNDMIVQTAAFYDVPAVEKSPRDAFRE